ncbi:TMhelix containing protein [Vibrio phage 1.271.B._10N.286.54.B4]|nr:TMhelix containing protein [Vibrio phage 1.027.O._10N.286.54.B8]AUR92377.1 TMhelix containing protein [Vibrio phage 1.171.O._10N.261.52.F12]AUR94430.1 TMhelix containing protein [Vibrio phage 1.194.O._10N.286.54.B1]AUR94603.1 TMhelix containing protein [Vibrio phage 1.196.O._10N.286.54.E12]AUR95070.1 TMhelix containing protein [Vibrio phage 1.200.O._10N.286.55.E1]AUR99558.1 TMhelix containing protein [Vibrio phage 1.267.O._10N.286.54.A1]AUR99643.1 TMhelix containing protein [Vibrio phage 1
MMLGQMMAEIKGLSQQMAKTSSEVHNQTQIIHDNQLEMGRYYAGLELANKDIQEIRDNQRTISDNQRTILSRLDETVSKTEFQKLEEHVKTLNGTDVKFRSLGIDINDPKSVEEWREAFVSVRSSRRTRSAVSTRVMQAVAVALVLALCAAAWNGGVKGLLVDTRQEQER